MSAEAGVWTCEQCGRLVRGPGLDDPAVLAEVQRSHGRRCARRRPTPGEQRRGRSS